MSIKLAHNFSPQSSPFTATKNRRFPKFENIIILCCVCQYVSRRRVKAVFELKNLNFPTYISDLQSSDLSELDQTFIDSNLSPQIAVITRESKIDEPYVSLIKKYPGIHVLIIYADGQLFFTSDTAVIVPVYEFFGKVKPPIWLVKDDLYFNCGNDEESDNFETALKFVSDVNKGSRGRYGFPDIFVIGDDERGFRSGVVLELKYLSLKGLLGGENNKLIIELGGDQLKNYIKVIKKGQCAVNNNKIGVLD
ncbi:hypothetical protein C1645_816780 [Glomus cerebriforme]|uniref:Uncharacterized protein n=1 Tax=Glomus cerebriforme TaxID=658196 RepID=A0A397TG24_9GLOM|nr:hypothetical protein C1645_816780 [Glomus cerebriforme]